MTDNEPYIPKHEWLPKRRRRVKTPPIGYMADPNDASVWIPDTEAIRFVEQAFDLLDQGNGLRPVASWLVDQINRPCSHMGLSHLWKRYRYNDKSNERAVKLRRRARKNRPKTPEEKAEYAAKQRLAGARKSVAHAEKNLVNVVNTYSDEKIESIADIPRQVELHPEIKPEYEVIFEPNDGPQTDFLAAPEMEVLYGGAAGGGKSYAMLADPMRYFHNKNFNGIILRRTNDELRELKWKSQDLYTRAFPGAKFSEKTSSWTFPSGARLWLTYLERDEDVRRYQGQAFCYIGFDELTQYPTPFPWNYMRSRLRTTDPTLPLCMRATTNPGGPGHGWVKRMFIDPAPYNTPFAATDIDTGEIMVYPKDHAKVGQPLFNRRFIPANLYDNPYLSLDGQYEANLLSLPESTRKQLLEGDWGIADGAAFGEFRTKRHTCKPFKIPDSWRRFRSCDYGYASHSAVHWYAIDPIYETLFVYREYYTTRETGLELARNVLMLENDEKILYGMLDSSVWQIRGQNGPSIAEEMIQQGCRWRPADRGQGSRSAGKNRLHELLKVDEDLPHPDGSMGRPGIVFFNTCRQIIADLPVIPVDPDGDDDIDARYTSDHTYDSIRYGIMSRPRASSPFDLERRMVTPSYRPSDPVFGY
jgi:hypothetical protein